MWVINNVEIKSRFSVSSSGFNQWSCWRRSEQATTALPCNLHHFITAVLNTLRISSGTLFTLRSLLTLRRSECWNKCLHVNQWGPAENQQCSTKPHVAYCPVVLWRCGRAMCAEPAAARQERRDRFKMTLLKLLNSDFTICFSYISRRWIWLFWVKWGLLVGLCYKRI